MVMLVFFQYVPNAVQVVYQLFSKGLINLIAQVVNVNFYNVGTGFKVYVPYIAGKVGTRYNGVKVNA